MCVIVGAIIGIMYVVGLFGTVVVPLLAMVWGIMKIFSNDAALGFVLLITGVLPLMLIGAFYGLFSTKSLFYMWVVGFLLLGAVQAYAPSFGCAG